MKLLGWMHRKFGQNRAGDIFKDFAGGPSCTCLCARPSLEEHRHHSHRLLRVENKAFFAEAEFVDGALLFEGLLTIGTLGSGAVDVNEEAAHEDGTPVMGDPETVEAIAEKQAEAATDAELMVVGEELEKVLLAEAEKGSDRLSSARPSHAGGKGPASYPLQGYLFGLPVEVAETAESDGRRKRRATLGELFMMSGVAAEEKGGGKREEAAGGGGDAGSTAGLHLTRMKKMLTRRRPSSASSGSGGGPRVTAAVETKLHKILQMFHRKVHPESSMDRKKHRKHRDNITPSNGHIDSCGGGGDTLVASKTDYMKAGIPCFESRSLSGDSDSSRSREYWIKNDSDYLVLEL